MSDWIFRELPLSASCLDTFVSDGSAFGGCVLVPVAILLCAVWLGRNTLPASLANQLFTKIPLLEPASSSWSRSSPLRPPHRFARSN